MNKQETLLIFLQVIAAFCLITLGWASANAYNIYKDMISASSQVVKDIPKRIEDCSNLGVEETAICLRDFMRPYHNYTVRTDEIRSFEDIKKNGGDCFDYSNLYSEFAKNLSFNGKVIKIITEEAGHAFAVIYNENITKYCILDQKSLVGCQGVEYD